MANPWNLSADSITWSHLLPPWPDTLPDEKGHLAWLSGMLSESRIFMGNEFTRRKPDNTGGLGEHSRGPREVARPKRGELWSAQAAIWHKGVYD